MNLDDVASALADKLGGIAGLRVHSEVPQQIVPPAAIVGMGAGQFATYDADMSVQFGVLVLLSATNSRGAQKAIRGFCAATGDRSIKAAVETGQDSFDGVSVAVAGWDTPEVVTLAGTDYIGVQFKVDAVE